MLKVYSGTKGFSAVLFLIGGIVVVSLLLIWGITKAAQFLLPSLTFISNALIILFLLCVLPVSYFKQLRLRLSRYCLIMSKVLSVASWMLSFLFVVTAFGIWGILLCFLFQFLAPVALFGAMLKGSWDIVNTLSMWIVFTYAMSFYGVWLARSLSSSTKRQNKSNVIDVEIEEQNTR